MTDDSRDTTAGTATAGHDSRDNPVVLSTIYTRTGDDGTTGLTDCSRVPKTDSRLAAYADTDEANCAIGVAITLGQLPEDMAALLRRIQNELFDCGADLATPLPATPPEYPQLRIDEGYVTALEAACDEYNAGACRRCAASSSPAEPPARRCCTPPGR